MLFEEDQVRYGNILLNSEASTESRIREMRDRVDDLRQTRERDRLAVVKEKLDEHWRHYNSLTKTRL